MEGELIDYIGPSVLIVLKLSIPKECKQYRLRRNLQLKLGEKRNTAEDFVQCTNDSSSLPS